MSLVYLLINTIFGQRVPDDLKLAFSVRNGSVGITWFPSYHNNYINDLFAFLLCQNKNKYFFSCLIIQISYKMCK